MEFSDRELFGFKGSEELYERLVGELDDIFERYPVNLVLSIFIGIIATMDASDDTKKQILGVFNSLLAVEDEDDGVEWSV